MKAFGKEMQVLLEITIYFKVLMEKRLLLHLVLGQLSLLMIGNLATAQVFGQLILLIIGSIDDDRAFRHHLLLKPHCPAPTAINYLNFCQRMHSMVQLLYQFH